MLPDSTGYNWPDSKQERRLRHHILPPQGKAVTLVITSRTTGPDICPPFYEVHKLRSVREGEMLQGVPHWIEGFIVENADATSKCPQLKYCISSFRSLSVCNLVKLLQLSIGGLRVGEG